MCFGYASGVSTTRRRASLSRFLTARPVETAPRVRCERGTLSRLLNGSAGVSANMALALEDIVWGTADHWMRM